MSRKKRVRSRRQKGFSLIVIFLLLALMAAAATAVLLATRTDTRVSGRHRETTLAFSAEAGIAYGKAFLVAQWQPTGFWTQVLDDPPNVVTYQVGGFDIAPGDRLPLMNSRYTFSFTNNPDDPGGPNSDTDGRVIVTSIGQALDRTGNKVLAQVTLQVEVQWTAVQFLTGGYQTQQNQSASGVSNNTDTGGVDMSSSRTF